jgi:hypothetical protein
MGSKSYKRLLEQQVSQEDYKSLGDFFHKMTKGFTDDDLQIVYELHAKYFNHAFNIPCGCGGARKMDTINKWINDLKEIYNNGVQSKELSE